MAVALLCVSLLGILLFGLGFAVSMARSSSERVAGYPDDPSNMLHKLVRAHGNTSEYVAMLSVLILLLGTREPSTWDYLSMVGATACRFSIALGIILSSTLEKPHPLRFVGALGTYLFGLSMCISLAVSLFF